MDFATPTPQSSIPAFLLEHPSTTYEPRVDPALSSEPITTVRSEGLPFFGAPELDSSNYYLGDFGEGRSILINVLYLKHLVCPYNSRP